MLYLVASTKQLSRRFFFFFSAGTASDSQRPPAVFSGASG